MRWSLKILDLDFVVQHRPGRKIGYADALSRHVAAIMPEYSLDKENIRREEEKMISVRNKIPGTFLAITNFFGSMMVSCTGAAPKKNIRLLYQRL